MYGNDPYDNRGPPPAGGHFQHHGLAAPPPPMHRPGGGGAGGVPQNAPDRTIFVGNIPFDSTEQQVGDHFSSVGIVTHVRMNVDPQTRTNKGFAFVEYREPMMAASAIRNLHNSEFRGRALRVDWSEKNPAARERGPDRLGGPQAEREKEEIRKVFAAPGAAGGGGHHDSHHMDTSSNVASFSSTSSSSQPTSIPITLGSLAPTVQAVAQPYGTDTIAKLVTSLTKPQLAEILSEMKKFSVANPDGAKQLLFDSPQVAQTLLHILVLFGLVRPGDVAHIQSMQRPVAGSMPQVALPGMPVHAQLPPPPPPPAAAAYMPPPAAPVSIAPPPQQQPVLDEQDAFMMEQIRKMSPEQVAQLPLEVQSKILLLQQQLALR